jgi:hypothetical protein
MSHVLAYEISKMQEVVTMLANLLDAAHRLPEGMERQNALREIRDYQYRAAKLMSVIAIRYGVTP